MPCLCQTKMPLPCKGQISLPRGVGWGTAWLPLGIVISVLCPQLPIHQTHLSHRLSHWLPTAQCFLQNYPALVNSSSNRITTYTILPLQISMAIPNRSCKTFEQRYNHRIGHRAHEFQRGALFGAVFLKFTTLAQKCDSCRADSFWGCCVEHQRGQEVERGAQDPRGPQLPQGRS